MENFTKVDNNVLEEVAERKFNASQLSVIMVVWRMTSGYHRTDHELAVNYFVKATGFSKRNIQETINFLIESKVLIETQPASFNRTRRIAFNENTDEWLVDSRIKGKQVKNSSPGDGKVTSSDEVSITSSGEQSITHKRNIKENIKKEEEERNPVKLFEQNFGPMTILQMEKIWKWVDEEFSGDQSVVYLAVEETALANPRKSPFNYLDRILNDWYRRKLFTVDEVLRAKEKFEEQQSKVAQFRPKQQVEYGGRYIPDDINLDFSAGEGDN